MTPGEFREIAKAMQEFGLSRVKMGDVEIECGGSIGNAVSGNREEKSTLAPLTSLKSPEDPIEHKIDQLASLMKLGDAELVDELFPDHTDQEESA